MMKLCLKIVSFFCVFLIPSLVITSDYITVAILAKDKAHTLPLYLECIEHQTWPKDRTYLYIRTNNNNDNTSQVLQEWINRIGNQYADIYFDDADVQERVEQFGQHEWNSIRFKVLGAIRQASINWAYEHNSHYFVADCDNFIFPETIESMFKTNLPIVSPLLHSTLGCYSNYHYVVDDNGYFAHSPLYFDIFKQNILGIIEVAVVHCTYLIRHEYLNKMLYDDNSARYEYVIFSDNARKEDIPQYIDNRQIYGYISFAETKEELMQEAFLKAGCY